MWTIHCLAVKKLSALSRGITSKHHDDFYCLSCFHILATKSKLQLHERVYKNKYFCNIIMPFKGSKILEFNQYQQSDKVTFITSAVLLLYLLLLLLLQTLSVWKKKLVDVKQSW